MLLISYVLLRLAGLYARKLSFLNIHLLGIPLPLPLIARCAAPGGKPCCGA